MVEVKRLEGKSRKHEESYERNVRPYLSWAKVWFVCSIWMTSLDSSDVKELCYGEVSYDFQKKCKTLGGTYSLHRGNYRLQDATISEKR